MAAARLRTIYSGITVVAVAAALVLTGPAAQAATPYTVAPVSGSLGSYSINGVYVAGVSSGGNMATQLSVAYSGEVSGAAVFAAGPYYCAQDNADQALYACASDVWPDDLSTLEADTYDFADYGWIDPTSNIANQHIYLFSGTNDSVVDQPVVDDTSNYYQYFGASVDYNSTTPAGHGWISPYGPNSCGATASPYVNNCGIDPEGTFLTDFFGSVNAPNTGPLTGQLIEFDQNSETPGGSAYDAALANHGFVYVPSSCAGGATCSLLVALHGCQQNYQTVGTTFIDDANLDQYADTNNMIVLYPQTTSSYPSDPYGCWDWWGYLSSYDTSYPIQGGLQMQAIWNMVTQLGG